MPKLASVLGLAAVASAATVPGSVPPALFDAASRVRVSLLSRDASSVDRDALRRRERSWHIAFVGPVVQARGAGKTVREM